MALSTISSAGADKKIQTAVAESLDVAFVICNRFLLNKFGPEKLQEVFLQIFPTAFALGNAYWPFFYITSKNFSLCICRRFGMPCMHQDCLSIIHCLNTDMTLEEQKSRFVRCKGVIKPLKYQITFLPTANVDAMGYLCSIRVEVQEGNKKKTPEVLKSRVKKRFAFCREVFHINLRLIVLHEITSPRCGLIFTKNESLRPFGHPVLALRNGYSFNERMATGYTLEKSEICCWSLFPADVAFSQCADCGFDICERIDPDKSEGHRHYYFARPSRTLVAIYNKPKTAKDNLMEHLATLEGFLKEYNRRQREKNK